MDWSELFEVSVSPVEMIVRGTAMYWFLFALFRIVIRRRVGAVGMGDVLILVTTLIAWTVFTDWLSYRSKFLEKLLQPPPVPLVRDGRILHRHLRHEFVSEDELRSKLREKGVADLSEVRAAYMETDGGVSVIKASKP